MSFAHRLSNRPREGKAGYSLSPGTDYSTNQAIFSRSRDSHAQQNIQDITKYGESINAQSIQDVPSGKWRGLGTSMTSKAKGKAEISLQPIDLIRRDWDGWVPEWIDTDKRLQLQAGDEIRHFFCDARRV